MDASSTPIDTRGHALLEDTLVTDRRIRPIAVLALALLVLAVAADAQPRAKVPRLGILSPFSPTALSPGEETFRQTLRDLGYVEGQTIEFEWRWADRSFSQFRVIADEFVRLNVDIIFAMSQPAIQAAQRATTTIPIVMMDVSDPVEAGFIRSLAHPGGNITGVTAIALELSGKQLALLKEAAPGVTRIAVLGTQAILALHGPEVQRVAQGLDVQLQVLVVEGLDDIANAFEHATRRRAGAVLVLPQLLFAVNDRRIAELAAQSQLPTIFWRREFAEVGGLLAYGASQQDLYRRAATYVDKILKGAKSGDLPVEQPTKFTLVINLKTAQALGLTIPPMLLFQADEVLR
jgi:ABC-type uncharacterized transport system substrate-binding protein